MRFIGFALLAIIMFTVHLNAQTLDDLRQIQSLKKQLEKTGDLDQSPKKVVPASESLTVFKDSLSVVPEGITSFPDSLAASSDSVEIADDPFENLEIFGFKIFEDANFDFNPEVYGPVDENYPVGPGDELILSVWGEVELRHELIVNRQGQIYVPEVGIISVLGMDIHGLKSKLKNIMGKSYSSLTKNKAFLDVALGKLRAVRVFVVGDVKKPGVFTVPAFTSPFNMLFYSAGLNKTGSMRNILLVRNDEVVEELDFYNFLTQGKKFSNVRLQNNDVILVKPAGRHVYLAGAVNKPAIFELKGDEGIIDLIEFSGGFRDSAYVDQIQVERYSDNKERKLIDINYRELKNTDKNYRLENGDRVFVQSINRELLNYISIEGPVYGPKRFEYFRGMTIKDLFARVDSIMGDAYLQRVQIDRTLANRRKQIFSVNLEAVLNGMHADVLLQAEDQINIKSIETLFPADSVTIYGAVNTPGKFLLKKEMTLDDLIFEAGGYREDAVIEEAEISRIDPRKRDRTNLATIVYVPINPVYERKQDKGINNFILEPYDNVFIRANSDWELQRNVEIKGEVQFPGKYTLKNKNERITDLIERAGGLKETAYPRGATLRRTQDNVGQIGLDFEKVFKNPKNEDNIYLIDGDVITIPEQLHTVKVAGGVNFPSSVLFEKGKGAGYYINSAGGFSELANEKNVSVRLANGRVFKQKRFLLWKYWPKDITAGSTIYVPTFAEKPRTDWSGAIRDAAAILSSVATTILIIDQVK
ncbi:MAG: SLBB domain-containing protein [Calditrichaceae bacterium]